ncbi:MAG: regulatory protein RecX [Deltaproteobacteria bacterium]|nr:regulatory protein RecX [Deltaproteobacteria bacterium]
MANKRDENPEPAFDCALKFLSYRARSEKEVGKKLVQLGFSEKTVAATIDKLRALHYLNDETFAREWARGRAEGRGYGPLRERELRQKGIERSMIHEVVREAFGQGEGKDKARALLEKRFHGKDLGDREILSRAVAFLQRRGYSSSMIAELVKQPLGDD